MSSTLGVGGTVLPDDDLPADQVEDADEPQVIGVSHERGVGDEDNGADIIPDLEADDVLENAVGAVEAEQETLPSEEAVATLHDDQASSIDDTASIPDDTPSLRGSVLSSPPSDAARSIASPARNSSPSSPRRPFDRRFQSRLSTSSLLTPRAGSPAFLNAHSRHSSVGSFALPPPSEPDESTAPWEVIRWNKLRKLSGQAFSEVGKRNFGSPTCMAVTDTLAIGTSRGMILVFDHQQNNKAVIGAGTKALECGPVTALAISADHTTIAAGHATGHILTWEIARPARPFLHIPPVDLAQPQSKRSDGHAENNDKGMAFSHLATRGMGAVARSVKTTRILGRYPEVLSRPSAKPLKKSSVLAFGPLPLGNVEQKTDPMGLVAMLTPYLLVIVSTTPIAQTQHKAARPKEVAAHSAMTAALAWFPAIKLKGSESRVSRNKLAYAWSNILTVLEVHEVEPQGEVVKDKPPELQFLPRNRYKAEEAIVAVQWLSRSILAVLTITQQLLIIEDISMNVTDAFDLLPKNIYHLDLYSQQLQAVIESHDEEDTSMHGVVADAFHMSVRAYKGRLFLLGSSEVWWGSLTNWADRLLALMNVGDFIGAIRLATRYYSGQGEKVTIGLPEDKTSREMVVGEKLFEMMNASLKYAFGKNQQAGTEQIEKPQMTELAEAAITACISANDEDFLFDTVFSWYDDHDHGGLFLDVLEPYILDGTITSIPPPALKLMVDYFQTTHPPSELEKIICLLDTSSMDIDQVTSMCKKYNLYDAYIYVWNSALGDFTTPLDELLQLASESTIMNGNHSHVSPAENAAKLFPYMSFILTGRTYPTESIMSDPLQLAAKSQIYDYFFTAIQEQSRRSSSAKGRLEPYSKLRRVLKYDTPNFMSALNEGFEDNFLNSGDDDVTNPVPSHNKAAQKATYNRQFIVLVMLEVMAVGFDAEDTIYLDMFVARNLPKYPQYMLLSGTALQDIFARLCHYPDSDLREECQLSVEYLLSVYHPSSMKTVIALLHEAQFYRVLKTVYRQEEAFEDVVRMYFADEDDREDVFSVIREFLDPASQAPDVQKRAILELVQSHAADLIDLDIRQCAATIERVARELHPRFLSVLDGDEHSQYQYLNALFGVDSRVNAIDSSRGSDTSLLESYIRLMCQFDPDKVSNFVESLRQGDLRLEEFCQLWNTAELSTLPSCLKHKPDESRRPCSDSLDIWPT
ncbi:Vacuolar protein sorting-associate-like protein [Cyphellophora attinorum]|uniref:Vacuolar protein sorting-associate-like protein n=1 Tax=Cyphellophora attinorum TaxID=1664694 RepID=A0A0N1P1L5_9EURO|nr:Vacuolar protein sorting-associate-like protein [Phialophora attinorum]KPI45380.1 Vacuolar protein sorting-associate-like protein [Phialophora attinorum]